jgi:16S rRNA (cytosine1402-N4)-methyltransferase
VEARHRPVLLGETLELMAVRDGGRYLDGTLGLGGHAEAILERSAPHGTLTGSDRDAEALALAGERLARFGARARLLHADYRALPALLAEGERFDAILLDLGISSWQVDSPERGFSFGSAGPLDMRMDRSEEQTAFDLVNRLKERELADLIYTLGEEHASRQIARAIVAARPLATTTALATVVRRAAGRSRRPGLDPATLTFQALRIAVNRELEGLGDALATLARRLSPGGRLVVIAFHSLEDRIVKQTFRDLAKTGFALLTKKPIRPSDSEVRDNPRSRSAKLRALQAIAA